MVLVLLVSIASEAAMGVGSAVCRMVEGARCVEDGASEDEVRGRGEEEGVSA
jgi:hypothetical protein